MLIQAVIFDVGGVLVRTQGREARRKWEARLGLPEMGLGRVIFGSDVSARALVGQATVPQVWRDVAARFGLDEQQMRELESDFWSDDWVDAELVQFVRGLRPRYKTAILSNAWPEARKALTDRFKLADAMDVMILSAEVGCAKPDARIYRIAVEQLGVQLCEAVFVDDMEENVAAAQALGMRGVRFINTAQAIAEIKRYLDEQAQIDVAASMQAERVARSIQKARKQVKRNRKPSGPRRRDWLGDLEKLDELDLPEAERVMPRGERERRQVVLSMALANLGEKANVDGEPAPEKAAGRQGIVVEVSSSLCRVDLNGRSVVCGLRGSLSSHDTGFTNVVAVGDHVIVSEDGSGRGVVDKVLPRHSALTRPDVFYGHLQQVIVANAGQLLIVAAWREPPIWLELIDRYLIAAERHHLAPIICVNKIDLAQDVQACQAEMQPYLDLGYRVIWTSALTGDGVRELHEALQGRTTVLAGVSGVGKSSLLAAVQPGLQLRIRTVSEHSHEGRHTTSQVTMLKLEADTFVVDTPGIREFGLSGLERRELVQFYPEITAAASGCRFGDCSHTQEPGCAVVQAVEQGRISAARYHSFLKIYLSLPDRAT